MTLSAMLAWFTAGIILTAIVVVNIVKKIRARTKWNTERRALERRLEERRNLERRKMSRLKEDSKESSDRREKERRSLLRRSDQNWEQEYKELRGAMDDAGFEHDSDTPR